METSLGFHYLLDALMQKEETFQFDPFLFPKGSDFFGIYAVCYFFAEIIDADDVAS